MENLCCKIECLRQRMHVTALEKGISHPDVLMISCELDEVLNEFYRKSVLEKSEKSSKWSKNQFAYKLHLLRSKLHLCSPGRKYRMERIFRMMGQAVAHA